jgi:hypothetical protein
LALLSGRKKKTTSLGEILFVLLKTWNDNCPVINQTHVQSRASGWNNAKSKKQRGSARTRDEKVK